MFRPFDSRRSQLHAVRGLVPRRRRSHQWLGTILTLLAVVSTASISACSVEVRYRMLSALFEDFPEPGEEIGPAPVVRNPRRPPALAPPATVIETTLPVPEPEPEQAAPRDWREFQRRMPKDAAGGIDWVRALEEKIIAPRPGIDPEAAEQPVFPLDVELVPQGQPMFKVMFPHKAHTAWLGCANCHPAIFKMQRGADPITMAKIFAGEYCGRCHGKVAFAVPTGCPRCHLALAGPK